MHAPWRCRFFVCLFVFRASCWYITRGTDANGAIIPPEICLPGAPLTHPVLEPGIVCSGCRPYLLSQRASASSMQDCFDRRNRWGIACGIDWCRVIVPPDFEEFHRMKSLQRPAMVCLGNSHAMSKHVIRWQAVHHHITCTFHEVHGWLRRNCRLLTR